MKVSPAPQLLTYLAQVRQLPFKSGMHLIRYVYTKPPFLPTKLSKKRGISDKEIAIIGIVRDVDWVARSRSTGGWLKVVGSWRSYTHFTSSRSRAEGRK